MALTLQTTTGYLDLFSDESISVDYNLADLRDPAAIFSPISKSFSLPATDVNNQFFKHYYDVSISGGFNAYAKQDVTLYSDDLIMISGYLQLLDVTLENTMAKQYQVLVAGENARFARNVGEKEISELDLESYAYFQLREYRRQLEWRSIRWGYRICTGGHEGLCKRYAILSAAGVHPTS
jgi:hypothetical protein